MDLGFDTLIRRTLRSAELPAAPASLRRTLDDLPRTAAAPRPASRYRLTVGLLAAGIVVIAVVALNGLLGQPGFGPGPGASPTPSPTPQPTGTPSSSTYPAYSVATLLAGRADGTVGDDPVIVYGSYTDLRDVTADPCPTQSPPNVEPGCLDRRQGLVDVEEAVGTVVDGHWTPNPSPALHPVWPERLRDDPRAARFFTITGPEQSDRQPIFVLLTGHFEATTFVVDEILQFDDPYLAATPAPSCHAVPVRIAPAAPGPDVELHGATGTRGRGVRRSHPEEAGLGRLGGQGGRPVPVPRSAGRRGDGLFRDRRRGHPARDLAGRPGRHGTLPLVGNGNLRGRRERHLLRLAARARRTGSSRTDTGWTAATHSTRCRRVAGALTKAARWPSTPTPSRRCADGPAIMRA